MLVNTIQIKSCNAAPVVLMSHGLSASQLIPEQGAPVPQAQKLHVSVLLPHLFLLDTRPPPVQPPPGKVQNTRADETARPCGYG